MNRLISSDPRVKLDTLSVAKFLDSLGEERITAKEQRMQNLLKEAEPDEALYREIMLALGYKNNKVQFLELAMILSYSEIKKLKSQELIEKALFYRAGLVTDKKDLPSNFDDSLKMKKSVWQYARTRPANYPEKRIKGASRLLSYFLEHGGICNLFEKVIKSNYIEYPDKQHTMKLSQAIISIFVKTKSVGKMRALEICFNIILPFFIAFFKNIGDIKYADFLHKVFEIHPPLSDNSITKKVKNQLFGEDLIKAKNIITSVKRYFGLVQFNYECAE